MNEATCPKCKGTDIAMILWGYPKIDLELENDLNKKKIVLGGCNTRDSDPALECNDCFHRWGIRDED